MLLSEKMSAIPKRIDFTMVRLGSMHSRHVIGHEAYVTNRFYLENKNK